MPIHWESEYSVGIFKLDEQHKIFINLINQLHDATNQRKTLVTLKRILRNLETYTSMHFKDEEHMLAQVGYFRLRSHRNAHREFSRKLETYTQKIIGGETDKAVKLANFLDDWLDSHLDTVDRLYVEYLKKRNIKPQL